MQLQIDGQGIEVTTGLRDLLEKKLHRLTAHFAMITHTHVVFKVDKIRQIAEATLHVPGNTVNATAESEDMYKSVDLLIEKLKIQLTKYKEKITKH